MKHYYEFAAIDAPGGFLFEWWSVFWDIFIARTNEKHSEAAAAYIEVCIDFGILCLCLQVTSVFSSILFSWKKSGGEGD